MYNKSLVLEMPKTNEINWAAYFRGVLEGDGWCSLQKGLRYVSVGISSGSVAFLTQIKMFLKNELDIDCLIYKRPNSNSLSARIRTQSDSIKFLNWIYKDAKYFLNRKYDNAIKFLNANKDYISKNRKYPEPKSQRLII